MKWCIRCNCSPEFRQLVAGEFNIALCCGMPILRWSANHDPGDEDDAYVSTQEKLRASEGHITLRDNVTISGKPFASTISLRSLSIPELIEWAEDAAINTDYPPRVNRAARTLNRLRGVLENEASWESYAQNIGKRLCAKRVEMLTEANGLIAYTTCILLKDHDGICCDAKGA